MGHVTYFLNFGTPSISREWLKLETSNLARILITRGTKKKCKIKSKGSGRGHVTCVFFKFLVPLHILETVEATNFKFGMTIDHPKPLTKNAKLRQRGS